MKRLLTFVLLFVSSITACGRNCMHFSLTVISDTATCEQAGTKTFVCDDCKKELIEKSNPLGHDYQTVSEEPATCTTKGLKLLKCTRCGLTKETDTPALKHNYVGIFCSRCGQVDPDYLPQTMTSSFEFSKSYYLYDKLTEVALVYFGFKCSSGSVDSKFSISGIIHGSSWYRMNVRDSKGESLGGQTFVFSGYSSSARSSQSSVTLAHSLRRGDTFYISLSAGVL